MYICIGGRGLGFRVKVFRVKRLVWSVGLRGRSSRVSRVKSTGFRVDFRTTMRI